MEKRDIKTKKIKKRKTKIKKLLKYFVILYLLFLAFNFAYDYYNLPKEIFKNQPTIKQLIDSLVILPFPEEYKQLFNPDEFKNARIGFTTEVKSFNYPVSLLNIDSLSLSIYKFKNTTGKNIGEMVHIDYGETQATNFIRYSNNDSYDVGLAFHMQKYLDTIHIIATQPFNQLVYSDSLMIFKGKLNTLSVILDKKYHIKTFFLEDRQLFHSGKPYYLIMKQKNKFVYIVFVETEHFNDNKVINLFRF